MKNTPFPVEIETGEGWAIAKVTVFNVQYCTQVSAAYANKKRLISAARDRVREVAFAQSVEGIRKKLCQPKKAATP